MQNIWEYKAFLLFVLCFLFISSSLNAQLKLNQNVVNHFFSEFIKADETEMSELFATEFLEKVPAKQLIDVIEKLNKDYGKFQRAVLIDDKLEVHWGKAVMPGLLNLNYEGKAVALWFGVPKLVDDNFEKIINELKKFEGITSLCILADGKDFISYNEKEYLAVGSAFKLEVLKVLNQSINSGKLKWEDVVTLDERSISLPSGILQEWRIGTPITISTLANLMISKSDNTATDMLMHIVGRQAIESITNTRNIPFITTREMFILKLAYDEEKAKKFIKADQAQRREMLIESNQVSLKEVNLGRFIKPILISDIEWFYSTEYLCKLIYELKGIPALEINVPLIEKEQWHYAGYKGGSETGVLNLTFLLQKTADSPIYALSATINNQEKAIPDNDFLLLIGRFIEMIKNL